VTSTTPSKGQFVITKQALLGPIRAQNLTILSLAISEKFKGCRILKWITWPWSRPFGTVGCQKANNWYSL